VWDIVDEYLDQALRETLHAAVRADGRSGDKIGRFPNPRCLRMVYNYMMEVGCAVD
jgi:hypothetical protein